MSKVSPQLKIIERDRLEHIAAHERERIVAADTAGRLEREVKETAARLERSGETTAARIEAAVTTALAAVADTAKVHAEAHAREHLSHERIHTVEERQVEKAELAQREAAKVLRENLDEYKKAANEWRAQSKDQDETYLRKDEANTLFAALSKDVRANSGELAELRVTVLTTFSKQTGTTEGSTDKTDALYRLLAAVGVAAGIAGVLFGIFH